MAVVLDTATGDEAYEAADAVVRSGAKCAQPTKAALTVRAKTLDDKSGVIGKGARCIARMENLFVRQVGAFYRLRCAMNYLVDS